MTDWGKIQKEISNIAKKTGSGAYVVWQRDNKTKVAGPMTVTESQQMAILFSGDVILAASEQDALQQYHVKRRKDSNRGIIAPGPEL